MHILSNEKKYTEHCIFSALQITDKSEQQFLNSWHELNKPHVLLFDQVPAVPLLFKVGPGHFC